MHQKITGDYDLYSTKQHKIDSSSSSSSHLTAIKRLADYCKQFSVTADIVMDTDELTDTQPDKRY